MYKRILVGTDGSGTSGAALREALRLAAGPQAQLKIVNVIDSPYAYADAWYTALSVDADAVRGAWRRAGEEILARAAAAARDAGVDAETAVVERDGRRISRALVDEGERWSAEMIVLGSHGAQAQEGLYLGSVAEGVARAARVPVLLVRG